MDFQKASRYWEEKGAGSKRMPREKLLEAVGQFLRAHNTCALATGSGSFVRCTPIEYSLWNGKLWMMSEGGLKFRALAENRVVCAAVFDSYAGFGTLGGLQLTGSAELIEPWSEEYLAFLAWKKLPEQALRGLDHPMYLIRLAPEELDFLSSGLKQQGWDARQHLTLGPGESL